MSSGSLQKTSKSAKSSQFALLDNMKSCEEKKRDQNYFSASSSEVCSLPSKMKSSKSSFRSRKNQEDETQPFWFFGSKANSFNRKYGVARPRSTGGKVSSENRMTKDWQSNTSSASGSRCTTPRFKRSTTPEKRDNEQQETNNEEVENFEMPEKMETNLKSSSKNINCSNLKSDKTCLLVKNSDLDKKDFTSSVLSSNTTFDKSSSNLPRTPNKSLSRPSSGQVGRVNGTLPKSPNPSLRHSSASRCRYSESHLPVYIKNHLSKNRLNSDSLLVDKEDFNRDIKSAERPKSCRISKLQRPKTASSILCGDSTSKVEPESKDDAIKRRGIKRAGTPNFQIVKKDSQSVNRDFDYRKPDSQVCIFVF